ncbi:MAG TPA: amylo-alpha-1,6-glucosidase [Tepidisphaeraceae bacterium]|jgi:predicted glycogen debranching enzyme
MSLYSIETYGELRSQLQQEWLITNGIGGFASGTVVGCNTRRYHGLLCAALLPPVGRVLMLNRLGEALRIKGAEDRFLEFSINQFGDQFHPRGDRFLRRFDLEIALARWEYEFDGIRVIKEIQMPWQHNVVGIRYTIDPGDKPVELSLMPFVRMMDFHALRHEKVNFEESHAARTCSLKLDANKLVITADAGTFHPGPDWWYGHTYAVEAERGMDDKEDLYTPGQFVFSTARKSSITLWAGVDPMGSYNWDQEIARRRDRIKLTPSQSPAIQRLICAADDFIVARKTPDGKPGSTVIAGYPWFADWGRDTLISLPGLFLHTGRFDEANQTLSVFAQYISEGMIPNLFDDYSNQPSYNTVDASLWFIHAAFEYLRLSGDSAFFEKILRPACHAIVAGYTQGTRYHIKVDPTDGLVTQGDPCTQLTWMDAKCNGVCFTPRQGKAVEINALWYHALRLIGDNARADLVAESFRKAFWLNPFRGLADVVDGSVRDTAMRPNQIFAVSLPNSPLTRPQQEAVVEAVRRELLTPVGLRSLAKSDPNYHGRYTGPMWERDAAYHNGTIWAWPIGAFLDAYLKVHDRSEEAIAQARRWLEPLLQTMQQGCIGQIGEIFEGDEPHRGVGCFAQAWSVAEALRLAVELKM